mgnify:CR=1 FL=1
MPHLRSSSLLRHLHSATHSILLALIVAGLYACQPTPVPVADLGLETPPDEPTRPVETVISSTQPPQATAAPAAIRINLGRPPSTLDPSLAAPLDAAARDLVDNLFIGLTYLDPDTGRIKPALAREWQMLEDGLTWYVYLRDDVFWVRLDPGTGELVRVRPVTAGDVVYAVRRSCRPDSDAPHGSSPLIYMVQGCREVSQQDPSLLTPEFVEQAVGVRVLNDVAVEFKIVSDPALFPTLMAMPAIYPVPSDLIASAGAGWTAPGMVWTSGPYTLDPTVGPQEGYVLVANPDWPFERTGNVTAIRVIFDSSAESLQTWEAGELGLSVVPEALVQNVPLDGSPAYRLLAQPASEFIAVAYETHPLDNADVRRALSLALDRPAIIAEVLRTYGETGLPASTIVPPGSVLAPSGDAVGASFDSDAARAALARAGYADCKGMPSVRLWVDDASDRSFALAQRMVEMWEQTLGCEGVFTIEQRPLFEIMTTLQHPAEGNEPRRPGLIMLGWQADYPDTQHWLADIFGCRELFPESYLDLARPCIVPEDQLAAASGQRDDTARAAVYETLTRALFAPAGEFPVIPVYVHARPLAINPWLEIYPQQAGSLRFDKWVVTR